MLSDRPREFFGLQRLQQSVIIEFRYLSYVIIELRDSGSVIIEWGDSKGVLEVAPFLKTLGIGDKILRQMC